MLLLESIRCMDGVLENLPFHQQRVDRAFRQIFPKHLPISLSDITVPGKASAGLFKCRVIYSETIQSIEYTPYSIRPVNSLLALETDELNYPHKFADRTALNQLFKLRRHYDDVLIIKNKLLTDTTYANVALYDGTDWYTPQFPLLPGTRRQQLLDQGFLKSCNIFLQDLNDFHSIKLLNAMMPFDEAPTIPVEAVVSASK